MSGWSRIASAVGAALSVPPAEWSRVLRVELGGDTTAIRQAKSLLRDYSKPTDILDGPPEFVRNVTDKYNRRLLPGAILANRFEIQKSLGHGGMGSVYQAWDSELQQSVALKVMKPEYTADAQLMNRFRREVKLGRNVRHPNVCRIHDLFAATWPDGSPLTFLSMELIQGTTLEQEVEGLGPLDLKTAESIALQILDAVDAVHKEGIIHGDLKCSNVMLTGTAENRRAVLMDFGLARRLVPSSGNTLVISDEGFIMGTPEYMPPEQIRGERIGPEADIHAVGAILFHMVTGRLPFEGPTAREVASQRLHTDAPRASQYSDQVNPVWDCTIEACLEATAVNRPATALEVKALLLGQRTSRRKKFVLPLAAKLAALLLIAVPPRSIGPPPDAAVRDHLKKGEYFLSARSAENFKEAIAEFRAVVNRDSDSVAGWVGLAEAYSGQTNWGMVKPAEGLPLARSAAQRAVVLDPTNARAYGILGYVISQDPWIWRSAEPLFLRSLANGSGDPKVHFWYGTMLGRAGRHDEAIRHLVVAANAAPLSLPENHQLAIQYYRAERNSDFLQRAQELVRMHPTLANSWLTLARAHIQLKRLPEAMQAWKEAERLGIGRAHLVPVLGVIELLAGRRDRAIQLAQQLSEEWRKDGLEPFHLASLYAMLGDAGNAVYYLKQGLQAGDAYVLAAPVTPWFKPIMNDEAFREFLRQAKLLD